MDPQLQTLFDQATTVGEKVAVLEQQFRLDVKAIEASKAQVLSPSELTREDSRGTYLLCLEKACDLRRQQMSTATTPATEDDIIGDISRIAIRLYDLAQSKIATL